MGERVVDKSRIRPNEINGSASKTGTFKHLNLGNRQRPLVRPEQEKSVPPVRTGRVADRSEMRDSNSWENRRIESRGVGVGVGGGGEKFGEWRVRVNSEGEMWEMGDMEMW